MRISSHESAAALLGLRTLAVPQTRHVTVPSSSHQRRGETLHRASLAEGDVTTIRGELVTTPLRTLVDLARCRPLADVVVVADSALECQLVTRRQLAQREVHGRGAACWRRLTGMADGRAQSTFESLTRVALLEARLGPVALQVQFEADTHPYDMALPWAKILIECDGWEHHQTRRAFSRDRAFGNRVAAEPGWRLVRLEWRHVWPDPADAVALVTAAAMASTGARARQRRYRAARNLTRNGSGRLSPSPIQGGP